MLFRRRHDHRGESLVEDSTRASVAAILGYVPGFLVPIAIARFLGANARTDAFFLALSVASLVANALGVTTQQAAIPFLVEVRRSGGDMGGFVGEISTILTLLSIVPILVLDVVLIMYIRSEVRWTARDVQLLHQFLWAFVPYILFAVLAGVYAGALNSEHRYVTVALSPAIRSGIVLVALTTVPWIGVYALVVGYVLGEGLRLAHLVRALTARYKVRLFAPPRMAHLPEFSRTAVAQMLGSGVLAFLPLLDRMMASPLGPGSISLLDYADRLWQVPIGFAMSGFMVTSLAHWSERLHRRGTIQGLARDTARTASVLFLMFLLPTCAFVWWRDGVTFGLFRSNKFGPGDLNLLARTIAALVAGTPLYVAGLTYTRAFLVLKRSDWLFGISLVQLAVKVMLNLFLIPKFGLMGIALATSATYATSTVLLVALFHGKLAATPAHGHWATTAAREPTDGAFHDGR
jgi:putative peptidoglycan lipid II flippase